MSGPVADHRIEDPIAFARSADRREGQVPVSALLRLQDRLAGEAGIVSYLVRGGCDARGRALLKFDISGVLQLRCDRCLGEFAYPLKVHTRVLLIPPGVTPEDDADPESPEWVEAGHDLEIQELVEEEIVLGLPLSVRHAPGKCNADAAADGVADAQRLPFAELAELLHSGRGKRR